MVPSKKMPRNNRT